MAPESVTRSAYPADRSSESEILAASPLPQLVAILPTKLPAPQCLDPRKTFVATAHRRSLPLSVHPDASRPLEILGLALDLLPAPSISRRRSPRPEFAQARHGL